MAAMSELPDHGLRVSVQGIWLGMSNDEVVGNLGEPAESTIESGISVHTYNASGRDIKIWFIDGAVHGFSGGGCILNINDFAISEATTVEVARHTFERYTPWYARPPLRPRSGTAPRWRWLFDNFVIEYTADSEGLIRDITVMRASAPTTKIAGSENAVD